MNWTHDYSTGITTNTFFKIERRIKPNLGFSISVNSTERKVEMIDFEYNLKRAKQRCTELYKLFGEFSLAQIFEAIDGANFFLKIDSAVQYGLMKSNGNKVNVERCLEWLEIGKQLGILPNEDYMINIFE